MTETVEISEDTKSSAKRETVATIAGTATTIVLGMAANVLIKKIGTKVHDKIANQNEDESE